MLFAEEALPPDAFAIGVVIGALFVGVLCGLWPLSAGIKKGRPGVGIAGFFTCLGAGFVLGILLALPTAIIFRLVIGVLDPPAPPVGDAGGEGLGGEPFNPYANGKRSAF